MARPGTRGLRVPVHDVLSCLIADSSETIRLECENHLADENVPSASIRRLGEAGQEVIAVSEELAGRRDLDVGALVFQLDLPAPHPPRSPCGTIGSHK